MNDKVDELHLIYKMIGNYGFCTVKSLLEAYDNLQQELQRKDNNWNELKEWLKEPQITYNLDASEFGIEKIECVSIKDTLNKIQELEEKQNEQ